MSSAMQYLSTAPKTMLAGNSLNLLAQLPDFFAPETDTMSIEDLLERAPSLVGLMVDAIDPVPREVIEAAPNLRVIASMGAGYDNIDLQAASERGVMVCNAPGFSAANVADQAIGLMIMIGRRMPELNRMLRQGRFDQVQTQIIYGYRYSGATLGIIGMGSIGTAVALRARAFNMRVLYTSRTRKPEIEAETGAEFMSLDELLEQADYVSLHTELSSDTNRMIGEREIALMKPTAVLVNTGRGGLVDTDALTSALQNRQIFGAGLDVTDPEPLPLDHPLFHLDNVFITPHTAFATHEALAAIAEACAQALVDVFQGRRPKYLVNPQVLDNAC